MFKGIIYAINRLTAEVRISNNLLIQQIEISKQIKDKLENTMLPVAVDIQSVEYALLEVGKYQRLQTLRKRKKRKLW